MNPEDKHRKEKGSMESKIQKILKEYSMETGLFVTHLELLEVEPVCKDYKVYTKVEVLIS